MRDVAPETDPPNVGSQKQNQISKSAPPTNSGEVYPKILGIPDSTDDDIIIVMTILLVAREMLSPGINSAAERWFCQIGHVSHREQTQ